MSSSGLVSSSANSIAYFETIPDLDGACFVFTIFAGIIIHTPLCRNGETISLAVYAAPRSANSVSVKPNNILPLLCQLLWRLSSYFSTKVYHRDSENLNRLKQLLQIHVFIRTMGQSQLAWSKDQRWRVAEQVEHHRITS